MHVKSTMQKFRSLVAILAIPVVSGMWVGSVSAQDNALGKQLYDESCATCHGTVGLGDGEFAQYLNVKPSDLTLIAKQQSDDKFPFLDVFMVVDGRTGVRGHGNTDMPIWGSVFQREVGEPAGPYGAELLIRARLVALVDYIESLQK